MITNNLLLEFLLMHFKKKKKPKKPVTDVKQVSNMRHEGQNQPGKGSSTVYWAFYSLSY